MSSSRLNYLPSAITPEAGLQHMSFRGTQTLCVRLFAGLHITQEYNYILHCSDILFVF